VPNPYNTDVIFSVMECNVSIVRDEAVRFLAAHVKWYGQVVYAIMAEDLAYVQGLELIIF
jgi:hypothetical protein